jgi:hypothetical protein
MAATALAHSLFNLFCDRFVEITTNILQHRLRFDKAILDLDWSTKIDCLIDHVHLGLLEIEDVLGKGVKRLDELLDWVLSSQAATVSRHAIFGPHLICLTDFFHLFLDRTSETSSSNNVYY